MKVYAVTLDTPWEGSALMSVFSSLEKAEAYVAEETPKLGLNILDEVYSIHEEEVL